MTEDDSRELREAVANHLNLFLVGIVGVYGDNKEVLEAVGQSLRETLQDWFDDYDLEFAT